MSRASEIREAMQQAARLDRHWQDSMTGREDLGTYTPWMPSDRAQFLVLLAEAVTEAPGDRFLEIGAGIGTRMLLAQQIFGLEVHGIERVPEYAAQGGELGLDHLEVMDAATYDEYGKHDIVFFNRPFQNGLMQHELEQKVWAEMASGAVVIAMNLLAPPPPGWILCVDDWEARRGVWIKP